MYAPWMWIISAGFGLLALILLFLIWKRRDKSDGGVNRYNAKAKRTFGSLQNTDVSSTTRTGHTGDDSLHKSRKRQERGKKDFTKASVNLDATEYLSGDIEEDSRASWIQGREDDDGETQFEYDAPDACLYLCGDLPLPASISVSLHEGRGFTIGRFDIKVGHPQSDFEFAPNIRGVSRHHATFLYEGGGCLLRDEHSKAGTFVNHRKILPGEAVLLRSGDMISFGSAGVDYIWKV